MKILFAILIMLNLLMFQEEINVVELTEKNFKGKVLKNNTQQWMVLVHSPKCHHCVEFKPTFEKIALNMSNSGTIFGEINCEK